MRKSRATGFLRAFLVEPKGDRLSFVQRERLGALDEEDAEKARGGANFTLDALLRLSILAKGE